MTTSVDYSIPWLCLVTFLLVLFFLAGNRDTVRLYVGDCVEKLNTEQSRGNLTPAEAWSAYAQTCADNYRTGR